MQRHGARLSARAWGLAGVVLLAALWLTGAPAWAWVLGLATLASAWVVVATLAETDRGSPPGCQGGPAPLEAPGSAALAAAVTAVTAVTGEVPPHTPPVDARNDALREAEQDALRYALSHDLRAPLRVIDGFARIVKEDHGRHLDKLGHDHLDRILSASARMSGMIDAILAQAQLAGATLARQDVDLSALVREVADEQWLARGDARAVQWVIQPGLAARADALLLRRVVENLIGNALKYSAKVEAPRVEFGCTPATNPPVFFVKDNGAGFNMQHADKLFGMFQRLHSAKDFEGTGVGLAGVRNIIGRHGGRVWAEARPGEGACFYFTLMDSAEAQRSVAEASRSD